jgi:transcriptional regulator with XRE-family HTH domain
MQIILIILLTVLKSEIYSEAERGGIIMKYKIGGRLRKYREAQGLNQKEFAERIGVGNGRVSNWEQGINRPDVDLLAKICEVLNVSPSELLDIRLSPDDLNVHERAVINQYRKKPGLQEAVDILLGVEADNGE